MASYTLKFPAGPTCKTCEGTGIIFDRSGHGYGNSTQPVPNLSCKSCKGSGKSSSPRTIHVEADKPNMRSNLTEVMSYRNHREGVDFLRHCSALDIKEMLADGEEQSGIERRIEEDYPLLSLLARLGASDSAQVTP